MSRQPIAGPISDIVPMIDLNPLDWLGEQAKETLADGFTSMMMGLWSAGMWLLKTAFALIDNFTPNVADPDLSKLYSVTLWIALVIALVLAFGQIGQAVLRQDGRGFGTLVAGVVQYGVVVACWVGVCAGIITGTSGLTEGLLDTLLGVDSFSGYAAGDGFVDTVSGTVEAATLGVCSLFVLVPAAFGHIVIMLVRSAALLILTATMPIAAAGALSDGTKSWMWKSIRWFLACALMEPLLALVLGLGTQFAWAGMPDGSAADGSSTAQNIGTSVVGAVILLVSCFTPLVLFRLLAVVDPGTGSGASFRSTMSANGGVAGLLRGKGAQGAGGRAAGSGAASETASDGRTTSENGAEAQTANRFQASTLGKVGGKVGGAVAWGLTRTGQVAQAGASMSVDVLGQSGIGNQGYYDTSYSPRGGRPHRQRPGNPQAFEKTGHNDAEDDKGGNKGVANDIPPQAQAAVEDGAFLA
jgi:type IV secretion system protein TrbL